MATVYLSIGTNLGNKKENIQQAMQLLEKRAGEIISRSSFYENPPWGFSSPNQFLNIATAITTSLTPAELLSTAKQIEQEMGRMSNNSGTYQDRIIDIDILLYEQFIIKSPALTIPHPLMHLRRFVLQPLSEIAPNITHPILNKTISELSCT
jgi:2-amino-4-hydroxy-6-hydroxymethyldihydropteridine diphosphokinase